jgi:hypothetical protein
MTVFIVGHGTLTSDRPVTRVPDKTAISFWVPSGTGLRFENAMLALELGDQWTAFESSAAGELTSNYALGPLDERQQELFTAIAQEGLDIRFIGEGDLHDGIRLCEGGDDCGESDHWLCNGVLSQLREQEIVYLACRVVTGEPTVLAANQYGGLNDESYAQHLDEYKRWLLAQSEEDRDQALLNLLSSSEESDANLLAYLLIDPRIHAELTQARKRAFQAWAGSLAGSSDPVDFWRFYVSQTDEERSWIDENPGSPDLFMEGFAERRDGAALLDYFDAQDDAAAQDWMDGIGPVGEKLGRARLMRGDLTPPST